MSKSGQYIIGSVLERRPTQTQVSSKLVNPSPHGFPSVQHRSKSAFARNKEARKSNTVQRHTEPPTVVPTRTPTKHGDVEDWREQISKENETRVANMTDEEREAEKREILERFGAGIGDVLKRVRQARESNASKERWHSNTSRAPPPPSEDGDEESFQNLEEVPISDEEPIPSRSSGRDSPPPALSRPESRSGNRADRKLRFAELGPNDVYVYESAPPSPRKKPLALPPALNDGTAVSLGQFHGKMVSKDEDDVPPISLSSSQPGEMAKKSQDKEPEEGTPEYIRRRFFPNAPTNDPNLAWMQGTSTTQSLSSSPALRFDLHGRVIPLSEAPRLPTYLGLHHHAEGSTAGYTLDDVFLLSRSTVPAQRATMLGVLANIAINLGKATRNEYPALTSLVTEAETIRKRIVAAGAEALNERGSVGARAIEVVWASLVGWDESISDIEGIELQRKSDIAIASLPLDHFLPELTTAISRGDAALESLTRLLAILHRLVQQSNQIAESIAQTPKLITNIFQSFLLTPIPPKENGILPEPAALQLLIALASASRTSAEALIEPTDALLRFLTPLPPSSPFPFALATSLLTLTLRFYTTLAKYGFYSHIATTAMEQFSQLGQYVLSDACTSRKLKVAWADLLSSWIVCAVDPHKTKPDHDILWSQVTGWGWKDELAQLSNGLRVEKEDWHIWSSVWKAQAQWLEGSKVNGPRGGEFERKEFMEEAKGSFYNGTKTEVVKGVLDALHHGLSEISNTSDWSETASHAGLLRAVICLWLACLPPHLQGPPSFPPFDLPYSRISEVCAKLTMQSLWNNMQEGNLEPRHHIHAREFSALLGSYLSLSMYLPDISEELWIAQALSIVLKFMPGDERLADTVVDKMMSMINLKWVTQRQVLSPTALWEKGGLSILKPFYSHSILPNKSQRVSPLQVTPQSIATSSTLRLPSDSRLSEFGLPIQKDWTFTPLNHLLRSADSAVLKHLPTDWDSSELEVTRASLFFARLGRDVLSQFSLDQFGLSKEEAVFGCMRVFMLEHGQPQNNFTEEVFRDAAVEGLMKQLLKPYSFEVVLKTYTKPSTSSQPQCNLEKVAERFLGPSTPFFQFYTDFVALYDAISFSNPVFGQLLLPPISMRYQIDYRKHLWDDFTHILKTIRTPCEQVLSSDLKEYLYPIEDNQQLIGAYLRAFLKDTLQGFLKLVAVHHIASNIWPDLKDGSTLSGNDRSLKLIEAVVTQGSVDAIREIATYRQAPLGPTWLPPECFEHVSDVAKSRLDWLRGLGNSLVVSRLQGLLD